MESFGALNNFLLVYDKYHVQILHDTTVQHREDSTAEQKRAKQGEMSRSIDRSIDPPLSLRVSRVHTRDDERKTDELRLIPSVVASDTCERRVYTNTTGWLGRVHREQNEFQRQVDG